MKVCIVGAGNMGLAMASVLAMDEKYEPVLYTGKQIDTKALILDDVENGVKYQDFEFGVEGDIAKALDGAEYVFVTWPAFLRRRFAEEATPHLGKGAKVCFVPGYGGAEYMCKEMIDNGVVVFGFQRVPYVARKTDTEATIQSRKNELFLASIPKDALPQICKDVEEMFHIPTVALKEYLAVTLAPTNPLIHLSGVYDIFKDLPNGAPYEGDPMFYEQWRDETSRTMFAYDDELQEVCRRMAPMDLSEIVSLKIHYESPTPEALTKKLKSIPSLYNVVKVPLVEKDGKMYPDFNNRMFVEDFPYGIAIIKFFALATGVETPTVDKILAFYKEKTGIEYYKEDGTPGKDFADTGIPSVFGLNTLEEVIGFYQQ